MITTPKPTTTAPTTTKAATTTVPTTKPPTTERLTTKPATTKTATTKAVTSKLPTQQPTRPAAHQQHPTTEDWVPEEFQESSISDYYSETTDETEQPPTDNNRIPETSTSNDQQRGTSNVVSTIQNDAATSQRSRPNKDHNEVTILQAIPVSKTSGKPQETVSRGNHNASYDNRHAPAQVAPIGHIIAIVVGAVFVITILAFLIILVVRQKKKARLGRYEHFSMDFKQDPVAWKDLDNRSDDTDPDLAVAKM